MLLVHGPQFGEQGPAYCILAEQRVRGVDYDKGSTIQILLIIYKYLAKIELILLEIQSHFKNVYQLIISIKIN